MLLRAILGVAVAGLAAVGIAAPAAATPEAPDLSGFTTVSPTAYVDGGEAYFQTPDGLLCGIRPAQGMAGCDGPLPPGSRGANQVVLSADQVRRGLQNTAGPLFVKATGAAAAVLPVGHKIVLDDFACAVDDAKVLCTKGNPVAQWLSITPDGTSVGPATPGLPAGFPDPNDFVRGDESYVVGVGAKNLFPVFTVAGGLTCKMAMFSGGVIGCGTTPPATLPGVEGGQDEVFAQLPGPVGTRRAGEQRFATPDHPGPVKQLPAGHRIDSYGATCMATDDGVACFGAVGGPPQGFQVSSSGTTTFGGS